MKQIEKSSRLIISKNKKWHWKSDLEGFLKEWAKDKFTAHLFCGFSEIGDVRVDIDKRSNANLIANLLKFPYPFKDRSFDLVIADPPYHIPFNLRFKVVQECFRISKQYVIFKLPFIPHSQEFELIDLLIYEAKRWWTYASFITVFSRSNGSSLDEKGIPQNEDSSPGANSIPFLSRNLNEKTRGKHANCPTCESRMKRLYVKVQYCKRLKWVAVGWLCVKCGKAVLGDAR